MDWGIVSGSDSGRENKRGVSVMRNLVSLNSILKAVLTYRSVGSAYRSIRPMRGARKKYDTTTTSGNK